MPSTSVSAACNPEGLSPEETLDRIKGTSIDRVIEIPAEIYLDDGHRTPQFLRLLLTIPFLRGHMKFIYKPKSPELLKLESEADLSRLPEFGIDHSVKRNRTDGTETGFQTLTAGQREVLARIYEDDFRLFGYPMML